MRYYINLLNHAMSSMSNPAANCSLPALGTSCNTCGGAVDQHFCPSCGESTIVHMPSAAEFLHEFVGHYVAFEGKLWKTLHLLVLRPGRLTLEFLAGRRVPFIAPLRLYLTLSLMFFLLVKLFGIELPQITVEASSLGAAYSHTVAHAAVPGKEKVARVHVKVFDDAELNERGVAVMTTTVRDNIGAAIAAVGAVNGAWMNNLKRFFGESDSTKAKILNRGFLAYLPYMLIGALPMFALYLKLIYLRSGRRYGEHLVFALHANSFAFLVAALMIILPGSVGWALMGMYMGAVADISVWDYLQIIPLLCLILYLPAAMRRVYGGSRAATCLRWLLLIIAHLAIIGVLTILAELIGILVRS